jgi:carbon catabolite-derepressing protein kinase
MDLQLYQIEVNNYLVDFRNLGYKPIQSTGQPTTTTREEAAANRRRAASMGGGASSSPFLFLECACRLIVELAVGPSES